jgi:hypothetical protein
MPLLMKEDATKPSNTAFPNEVSSKSKSARDANSSEPLAGEELVIFDNPTPLPEAERAELDRCEETIRKGLRTFFLVGTALVTIRDRRLYRASHPTFEAYCQQRWGIGRNYAWRVIGAAERIKLLPAGEDMPKPTTEFQVRPFLKLDPKVFPKAWEETLKRAGGGKITLTTVKSVVRDFYRKSAIRATPKPARRSDSKVPVGQIIVLLHDAKKRIEKREVEDAVAVLERIERLLLSQGPVPENRTAATHWK